MKAISKLQAAKIAKKHCCFSFIRQRLLAIDEGSTEDLPSAFVPYGLSHSRHCPHCWIVTFGIKVPGAMILDGPEYYVWVDQATGEVVRSESGGGG